MEECRKRKLNQKAKNLFATKSGVSGLSSGISGHPDPDYLDSHPEYPNYHPEYPDTPIRTIRILIRSIRTPHPDYPDLCPESPDTPPGLSGSMSGVSGYTRDVSHRSPL